MGTSKGEGATRPIFALTLTPEREERMWNTSMMIDACLGVALQCDGL